MLEMSTILVVPCFNEAGRLSAQDFRHFAETWRDGSFLFVDDGSSDGTFAVLSALRDSIPGRCEILRLPQNAGKAEAVRRGMLRAFEANPEYVGFWDADLATPLAALPLFESVFRERLATEMVLGARVRLLGRDIDRRAVRHYLGRIFATAVALVLGVNVYDSQCGAKLFRNTNGVRVLFEAPFLSRWIFDVEILARFLKSKGSSASLKASVYELPLPVWRDVGASKVRLKDFVRAIYDLVRIRRSLT
jgi:glycosyltransferase involved in cell wall biosynthesis